MIRDDADWRDEPEPYVPFEKAGEHTARKRHTCSLCYNDIKPGTRYFRHTALVDGELIDEKYHLYGQCIPRPPTDVCPQPCGHLSQHDAREGRTCPEHPCTCADVEIRRQP